MTTKTPWPSAEEEPACEHHARCYRHRKPDEKKHDAEKENVPEPGRFCHRSFPYRLVLKELFLAVGPTRKKVNTAAKDHRTDDFSWCEQKSHRHSRRN